MLFLPAFGWLAREVYAWRISPEPHAPTLMAAKAYTDEQMNEVRRTRDTVEWMAATMEAKWGVRRPGHDN